METITLLGVPIHNISNTEAKTVLWQFLRSDKPHVVATVNPEIMNVAARDSTYRAVLQKADLVLPDGVGLRVASWIGKREPLRAVIPGADIAAWLLEQAELYHYGVTCIVRSDGRSQVAELERAMRHRAPHARIEIVMAQRHAPAEEFLRTQKLAHSEIVMVGLGFPFQEQWIVDAAPLLARARIIISVGGTFDFWTGVARRAPLTVRRMGLEWLWRVAHEPRRMMRIIRAVIIFPLLVFREKHT